jgi:hypothetical protein
MVVEVRYSSFCCALTHRLTYVLVVPLLDDVDDSFTWALRRQQNAPPVVTILRSHGGTGYIPYIAGMTPTPKSVSTFVVHSRAGSEDPFVLDWIDQTTTLFFAGGFQNEYWGTVNTCHLFESALEVLIASISPSAASRFLGKYNFELRHQQPYPLRHWKPQRTVHHWRY